MNPVRLLTSIGAEYVSIGNTWNKVCSFTAQRGGSCCDMFYIRRREYGRFFFSHYLGLCTDCTHNILKRSLFPSDICVCIWNGGRQEPRNAATTELLLLSNWMVHQWIFSVQRPNRLTSDLKTVIGCEANMCAMLQWGACDGAKRAVMQNLVGKLFWYFL